LWIKYEFGIGGRKPAKDFTPTERGKAKYNYHQQKVFWDVIAALVWGGWGFLTLCVTEFMKSMVVSSQLQVSSIT
jgi:hypothetical protein